LLELGMVDHLVHLARDQPVKLSDASIKHGLGVAAHRDRAREHLRYELLDHVLAALTSRCLPAEPAPLDDLIEQTQLGGFRRGLLLLLRLRLRHPCLPRAWRRNPALPRVCCAFPRRSASPAAALRS